MSFAEHNTYAWHKANYQRRNELIFGADGIYVPRIKVLDPLNSPQQSLPTVKGAD